MTDPKPDSPPPKRKTQASTLLAVGGGNSTAIGVNFQGALGAALAAVCLSEGRLDRRIGLGAVGIRSLRFETEAPVDDVLVQTTAAGFVLFQNKASLDLGTRLATELGKTALEIVRTWKLCERGTGARVWDRPLLRERDRFVIAVGPAASGTIVNDLATALDRLRDGANEDTLNQEQKGAYLKFSTLLSASWQQVYGEAATGSDIKQLTDLTVIARWDFEGADRQLAEQSLSRVLVAPGASPAAFDALAASCQKHMAARSGLLDVHAMRRALEEKGLALLGPPEYQQDIESLTTYSAKVAKRLAANQAVRLNARLHAVERWVTTAAMAAVQEGSLLLTGEPGAGKSAVLSELYQRLMANGQTSILLAVDALPVQGLDGLREELSLNHPVTDVIANWPGAGPCFLLVDALDAARNFASEPVFRNLIEGVMGLPERRWRVIASIRSFDLRVGERYRALFAGVSISPELQDPQFASVRHVQVSAWTQVELDDMLSAFPKLAAAVSVGGHKLRDLARVPFNTQLLAELIDEGLDPTSLGSLSSQVDLLNLYWEKRVTVHGASAEASLKATVDEMVAHGALRAKRITAAAGNADGLSLLLKDGVLVSGSADRFVVFRHHILFDYSASKFYLDPWDAKGLKATFRRDAGKGLILGAALGYALKDLWTSNPDRREFWSTCIELVADRDADALARSVVARLASELPMAASDTEALIRELGSSSHAYSALHALVGALNIRTHSGGIGSAMEAWAHVASALASRQEFAGLVNHLLFLLTRDTA